MAESRTDAAPQAPTTMPAPATPPRARNRERRPGAFRRIGRGMFKATEVALHPRTNLGRFARGTRRVLFGAPLQSSAEPRERLSKPRGLAVLASDNMSSSAYATEEMMRILILGGAAALALTVPLSLAVVAVLAVVVASYTRVITAYPNGGGSYASAKENLGTNAGLVAAAALFTDYVLTVSVSVSAGVAAMTSMLPDLFPYRVGIAVTAIALLTVGNLRGVREASALFALPTYLFLASMFGLLGYGLWRWSEGTLPVAAPAEGAEAGGVASALGLLLVLRAFASGAVALTGVEAVSNGVPAFQKPEPHNARVVLLLMGALFAVLFLGISFLASTMRLAPPAGERETLLSVMTGALVGRGPAYVVVQVATAVLLLLAANTSFTGFPRLNRNLAADGFMPKTFAHRGERLAFTTGILSLALLAVALVVLFRASVSALIPLYTVGVFIAFTLSQAGMVVHWRRTREPRWRLWTALNGLGALATGIVAIEVATVKFVHGAWIVLLLLPLLVLMMRGVHRHLATVREELKLPDPHSPVPLSARPHRVIVPVSNVTKAAIRAVAYAQSISSSVTAVHIAPDRARAERFQEEWKRWGGGTALVLIESPYRKIVAPLLSYIDEMDQRDPGAPITVVVPEFVPRRWWQHLLHSQTASRLRGALRFRPNTVVTSVPYHLDGEARPEGATTPGERGEAESGA